MALAKLLAEYPRATVALEAGTHSPWISRHLTGLGAKVIVANRCLDDARRRPIGIKIRDVSAATRLKPTSCDGVASSFAL